MIKEDLLWLIKWSFYRISCLYGRLQKEKPIFGLLAQTGGSGGSVGLGGTSRFNRFFQKFLKWFQLWPQPPHPSTHTLNLKWGPLKYCIKWSWDTTRKFCSCTNINLGPGAVLAAGRRMKALEQDRYPERGGRMPWQPGKALTWSAGALLSFTDHPCASPPGQDHAFGHDRTIQGNLIMYT